MIWECETTVIVMACNESESGKYKCESYWPQSPDEEQQYGNITGKFLSLTCVLPDGRFSAPLFHLLDSLAGDVVLLQQPCLSDAGASHVSHHNEENIEYKEQK